MAESGNGKDIRSEDIEDHENRTKRKHDLRKSPRLLNLKKKTERVSKKKLGEYSRVEEVQKKKRVVEKESEKENEDNVEEEKGEEKQDNVEEESEQQNRKEKKEIKKKQYRCRVPAFSAFGDGIDEDVKEELMKRPFALLFDAFHSGKVTDTMLRKSDIQIYDILEYFDLSYPGSLLFSFGGRIFEITDEAISAILGLPTVRESVEASEVDEEVKVTLREIFGVRQQKKKKGEDRIDIELVENSFKTLKEKQPTDEESRKKKIWNLSRLVALVICADFLFSNVVRSISWAFVRAVFGDYNKIAWAAEVLNHLEKAIRRPKSKLVETKRCQLWRLRLPYLVLDM